MLEKTFKNEELGIELKSFIDYKQNIWFLGKDVAKILGYSDTDKSIRRHVNDEDKYKGTAKTAGGLQLSFFINESGFYSPLLSSKLESAKKFKHWVTSQILPSIRKYGYYKRFDNPSNKMFKIENEMDLHCKVVELIRNFYPNALLVPELGENQDTPEKRINSWKKGYMRGQPDLMTNQLTNNYCVSESQLKMKEKYCDNEYAFILSNDYDKINKLIHKYMVGVRIPCEYCTKAFRNKKTLNNHYKVFHRIEKNI